ncbi:unnamed protein product [Acanthoscelides obtectus]|uniref:CRAL-TRIO domain-containing protein n=1 Tax=Acanthoscelides obtectus TaxID=200917 RepID=A0A9P0Q5E4_ACAOB|nr:unnamed protein product [Acanthoscelides obtectus]CAK1672571.1 Protein prune homolog 2 [Acanthoscelides obtectus]
MSESQSPVSEKMDISENSNTSSQENEDNSQVLILSGSTKEVLDNAPKNNLHEDNDSNKESTTTMNATNSHPLMKSPSPPLSPDFPDLIPEKPKAKHASNFFTPNAHSSYVENETIKSQENVDYELDLEKYNEEYSKFSEFPRSPSLLRKIMQYEPTEMLPDVSSDTENDKSAYEAHLSSNFQHASLTLNAKEGNLNFLAHNKRSNKLRRVKVLPRQSSEDSDVSSIESHSDSLKSEDVFNGESENTEEPASSPTEPIEPLSAAEERRHARHWQRAVLPGGEQRTIDMRVIEPYKRVLSHGGYLRAGGHTAIVLFSACYLPDRSRVDYDYVMDNLFLYVLWTLERLVTDDYVLVYLHGGATKLPSFGWLKRCYHMVSRKLRKNLSHLYIVHPTLWIKTMLFMAKPFISSKFYRKISYISTLRELTVRVPIEIAAIPDKVKAFDSLHAKA